MFITRQALRCGTSAVIGILAAACLAACEPRSPSPDESEPAEPNPALGSPPAASSETAVPGERPVSQPPGAGPAAPVLPPATERPIGAFPGQSPPITARADLEPVGGGTARGIVEFTSEASGMVAIHARLMGLEPGEHGLHVHERGDCSSLDGSAAGAHLAPEKDLHGSPDSAHEAHHAGDLGNVTADAHGNAEMTMRDDELELNGDHGVVGRAVVVHMNQDDLETQPSGNSGDPAACGVVQATAHSALHAN